MALSQTKIPASLREQLALTVAGANACDYCASAHTTFGRMHKIEEAEMTRNLEGQSSDARTGVVLAFARKIVDLRGRVADADLKAMRAAGFSDAEIVDVVAIVSQNIFTNYFNHIAGTEIDFPVVSSASVTKAA